jgi:hypothetical protein
MVALKPYPAIGLTYQLKMNHPSKNGKEQVVVFTNRDYLSAEEQRLSSSSAMASIEAYEADQGDTNRKKSYS